MVFGGLARAGLAQSGTLAASLAGLRTLDLIGVTPVAAVGYSLGELRRPGLGGLPARGRGGAAGGSARPGAARIR